MKPMETPSKIPRSAPALTTLCNDQTLVIQQAVCKGQWCQTLVLTGEAARSTDHSL